MTKKVIYDMTFNNDIGTIAGIESTIGDRRGRAHMRRLCLTALAWVTTWGASACGDDEVTPPPVDAPMATDAAVDAGVVCPSYEPVSCAADTPCTAVGQDCVADVCVATCGQDVSGLADALGEQVKVIANICATPNLLSVDVNISDSDSCETVTVYNLSTETDADSNRIFSLDRYTLDPSVVMPEVQPVGSATVNITGGVQSFAGGYLAIAPATTNDGTALFGYTTADDGFPGEVIAMNTADGTYGSMSANGNFDAVWIDDERYLLNGTSAGAVDEGLGVYHVDVSGNEPVIQRVVSGFGDFSGAVAIDHGRGLVFVGGFYSSDGDRVYVIPLADIDAALADGAPIDAAATAGIQSLTTPSSFSLLGDRFINFAFGAGEYRAQPFTVGSDDQVSLGAAELMASQAAFSGVTPIGIDRALIHHDNGVLLVSIDP